MIDVALLVPSFLVAIEYNKNQHNLKKEPNYNHILRDLVLLVVVTQIDIFGFSLPLKIFRFFAFYVIASEIINNAQYRFMPPNKKLKEDWANLQKKEIAELLQKYLH
jgi:hypothetical protein